MKGGGMGTDGEWRAYIATNPVDDPLVRVARLYLTRREGNRWIMLGSDGAYEAVEEGSPPARMAGIALPLEAIEAVARAIEDFQGHSNHASTEAAVLREWLAVERARVDAVLSK